SLHCTRGVEGSRQGNGPRIRRGQATANTIQNARLVAPKAEGVEVVLPLAKRPLASSQTGSTMLLWSPSMPG
ncbi:hypothetical protein ACFL6C_13315, partial [Myxococcota bacterium]